VREILAAATDVDVGLIEQEDRVPAIRALERDRQVLLDLLR